ncbi:MAG: hypothetical protein IPM66_05295 [Acidobacteriota bacterium]|nr:MAG: hypothetical protein IPM66_05295 [Acidobacteriota bacterium]
MTTIQQKTALFILFAGACVIFIGRFYYMETVEIGWRSILVVACVASAAIILFWFVPAHRRQSTAIVMLGIILVGRYWFGDGATYWQSMALIGGAVLICLIGALWPDSARASNPSNN